MVCGPTCDCLDGIFALCALLVDLRLVSSHSLLRCCDGVRALRLVCSVMLKHTEILRQHILASDCASTQRRGRKGPCPGTSMYDKFYATCYYDKLQEAYPPMVRNGTGNKIPDLRDMEVCTDARVLSP